MPRFRIFCVDDDLITLGFLGDVLGELYEVGLCATAGSAVARAATFRPDIIMLGYNMPGLSCEALVAAFKANADLHSVPAVIFTAYSDSADIGALMAKGIRGLIEKPITPEKLLEQLAFVLENPDFV